MTKLTDKQKESLEIQTAVLHVAFDEWKAGNVQESRAIVARLKRWLKK